MRNILIAVAFIVIVGVGALFIFSKKGSTPAPSTENTTPPTSTTQNQPADTNTKASAATITYTDNGFSPKSVTVKVGDTITVKNQSSIGLQFSSDPHPVHTGDKELNQQEIPVGGTITFTVNEKGTHGYHNHLNPSDTGTIVVE